MERVTISIKANGKFNSLYKLAYFLVDLNSICNFAYKINNQSKEDAKTKKYQYAITSRNLNKESLEIIELIEFGQGSFHTSYIAPIIVGIVIVVATKYINQEQNNKIEITTNNITINNINVHTHNYEYNNYDYNCSLFIQDINDAIKKLENQLEQQGLLYDEEGKRKLFQSIVRLKKLLNDEDCDYDDE